MRKLGIRVIWVSPYKRPTIDVNFDSTLKNILDRKSNPKIPNSIWVTDITYIHTLSRFVYITSVMDLYSRAIVGWHLSDSISTAGVLKAVERAKSNRKLDLSIVIHSDKRYQYISKGYIKSTPAHHFIRSYSKKSTPWGNAVIESFYALIKREWLNRFVIQYLSHARELMF